MLNDELIAYVDLKRTAGFKFKDQAVLLKSFVAFATTLGDMAVRTETVLEWAAIAPSPQQRRKRLLTVRSFALAIHAENLACEVPAADALGRARFERRTPYIYTYDEITRLVQAADKLQPQGSIKPVMYAALFGLLAATGLRVSEALSLQCDDITEDGMIIRKTKFKKSRLVPLHETTQKAIDAYLETRRRHKVPNDSLFISLSGHTLSYRAVGYTFRKLISSIELRGKPGQPVPRIHDLRHTFAVRSLEQCGHDRNDIARHIVALSTYLGHTGVTNTYWYLQATPILMQQIAEAAETMHQGDRT